MTDIRMDPSGVWILNGVNSEIIAEIAGAAMNLVEFMADNYTYNRKIIKDEIGGSIPKDAPIPVRCAIMLEVAVIYLRPDMEVAPRCVSGTQLNHLIIVAVAVLSASRRYINPIIKKQIMYILKEMINMNVPNSPTNFCPMFFRTWVVANAYIWHHFFNEPYRNFERMELALSLLESKTTFLPLKVAMLAGSIIGNRKTLKSIMTLINDRYFTLINEKTNDLKPRQKYCYSAQVSSIASDSDSVPILDTFQEIQPHNEQTRLDITTDNVSYPIFDAV